MLSELREALEHLEHAEAQLEMVFELAEFEMVQIMFEPIYERLTSHIKTVEMNEIRKWKEQAGAS